MQVTLKVLVGASAGKELKLAGDKFVIGRADDCDLRPKSDSVSRKHCAFTIRDSQVFLQDLGSRNGTHLNGERLAEEAVQLNVGDTVRVGRLEFEVLIDHSLGGAKRPKVRDVKEVAARTADTRVDDTDISDWLEEGNEVDQARRLAEPETRQFRLDETDRVVLDNANETAETTELAGDATEETTEEEDEKKGKKKKEYGKLPKRPEELSEDSREAAASTLKKFFNRR